MCLAADIMSGAARELAQVERARSTNAPAAKATSRRTRLEAPLACRSGRSHICTSRYVRSTLCLVGAGTCRAARNGTIMILVPDTPFDEGGDFVVVVARGAYVGLSTNVCRLPFVEPSPWASYCGWRGSKGTCQAQATRDALYFAYA